MKPIRLLIRYGLFPIVYFGFSAAAFYLVTSGTNTWITLPVLVVAAALLIALCEHLNPYHTQWRPNKSELKLDLLHYGVNYGVKQVAVVLMGIAIAWLPPIHGIWPRHLPFVVQVVIAALAFDFVLYWIHRLSHQENLLWRLHTIHHSPNKLYLINGEKRHPFHQIAEGVPALAFLIVLGAPTPIIVAFLTFLNFNMLLQHANVDYRIGPLKYLLAGAETHRYHHFKDIESKVGIVNLAQIFVPYDLLFRTFHYSAPGVGRDEAGVKYLPDFPTNYIDQMRWPFATEMRKRFITRAQEAI